MSARTADRHTLYQVAVQNVEAEIDFVDRTYTKLRGRRARRLREDFCGTYASSCEWVRRRADNTAIGLDLDQPTLDWGRAHNHAKLKPDAAARVATIRRNVLHPPAIARGVDVLLAMNFSYWVFKTREQIIAYFRAARASLAPGGLFFLDHFGGWESMKPQQDRRREKGFTYIWDQARYNPITGDYTCHIHFKFRDGTTMRRAFTYDWRLWTLPEVRDLLAEAGFKRITVYWEGDDGKGGGNGVFRPSLTGEACAAFITYIVADPR
ncbi:MAG: class I SAM-dependent methyltransferase [Phycisphaerales bacterium]|nr:class I SAM-dependent methyltransferase [Phycisphaerales bacterium]